MLKIKSSLQNHYPLLISLLGGLAGAVIIMYITRWGPWAHSDSVSYVEAARNLATGGPLAEIRATGAIIPFDKQPPLYPWLLALGYKVGLSLTDSARIIDITAFSLLVFSVGMLVARLSTRPWLPALAMLIILTSPLLLEASSGVMTEALFLMLSFVGLALLAVYLIDGHHSLLVSSAIVIALSTMTRYAGMVSIATGLTAIVVFHSGRIKTRIKLAAFFGLIAVFPLAIWLISRLAISSQLASPQMHLAKIWQTLEPFRVKGVSIIWDWLPILGRFSHVAYRLKLEVEILLGLTLLVVNLVRYFRPNRVLASRPIRLAALILLFQAGFHLLFMAAVTILGPWEVRIDPRQLTPEFLFGVLALLLSLEFGTSTRTRRWLSFSLQFIIVAALLVQNFSETRVLINELHTSGRGYTARIWHDSELLQAVESLPSDMVIISNDIEGLMYYTGISAYRFTEIQEGIMMPINEPYGSRLDDPLQRLYAQDCAAIVLFENEPQPFQQLYGEQANTRIHSIVSDSYQYSSSPQGGIYFKSEACADFQPTASQGCCSQ